MKVIDQDGHEQTWTAVSKQYGTTKREDCETLDAALGYLYWGRDNGLCAPVSIELPNGEVIEGEELDEALDRYDDAIYGK